MSKEIKKTLIITNKDDAHADAVIARANGLGYGEKTIRLNTEDFNSNCKVVFDGNDYKVFLKDSLRSFFAHELAAVWYRRPKPIDVSNVEDEGVATFIQQQAESAMRGLFFLTHETARWVNPLPALHFARQKLPQLKIARQIGFSVPATLVSNDPDEVKKFFALNKIVCNKSLDEPNYMMQGRMHTYLTQKFSSFDEIASEVDSVRVCPTMFQEYIEKEKDVRVVIIGDQVTAVEIDSQAEKLSEIDFRGISPHLLKHSKHNLPADVSELVKKFVRYYGLLFSAMDLVLDKKGTYYFIENNCNGQWLWLDNLAGTNLVDDMIHLLYE